jgi:hypothetical protein
VTKPPKRPIMCELVESWPCNHFLRYYTDIRIMYTSALKPSTVQMIVVVTTVTIEQWALIKDCLFSSSWFRQFSSFGRRLIIFDEMRTWFKISFLRSRNSTFRNKTPKSVQCRKREHEIKRPWNLGLLKHY